MPVPFYGVVLRVGGERTWKLLEEAEMEVWEFGHRGNEHVRHNVFPLACWFGR